MLKFPKITFYDKEGFLEFCSSNLLSHGILIFLKLLVPLPWPLECYSLFLLLFLFVGGKLFVHLGPVWFAD
jgi:hypothetical protein